MREHRERTTPDDLRGDVVLPADSATLARSLSGGLVLVAHTGAAHLGLPVDRRLLSALARARPAAAPRSPAPDRAARPRPEPPEAIRFRHATAFTLRVIDPDVHLTLHARGDPARLDVHVQLRLDRTLLEQLVQHRIRRGHAHHVAAISALLVLTFAVVIALALGG